MQTLPNGFVTYDHQDGFLEAVGNGIKRFFLVWHRRAGKDLAAWNATIFEAMYKRTGTYYYFFPTYAQAKKVMWDGYDSEGRKILHYIPCFEQCRFNETEMQITLPNIQGGTNGSIIQFIGTDKMDYVVGTNPIWCVFSEFAIQNPQAWIFTEPILGANDGVAIFVTTPRGKNHAYRLFDRVQDMDDWYTSLLTIKDTYKHDGSPIFTMEYIERLRKRGADEAIIQQEYFSAWEGSVLGSFYARLVHVAEADGRVRDVALRPEYPVYTYWDIGHTDETVVGMMQYYDNMEHWVDCIAQAGEGLPYFASELETWRKRYHMRFGGHYFPHDMAVTDYGSGEQRIHAARKLGLTPAHIVPKLDPYQGIDAVRRRFPRYVFDKNRCRPLYDALRDYTRKQGPDGEWLKEPKHDQNSHKADMVRYQAVSQQPYDDTISLQHTVPPCDDPLDSEATENRETQRSPFVLEGFRGSDPFRDPAYSHYGAFR